MHMVSREDLNFGEMKKVTISKNPTTVVTANGEVLTKEEATEYVKELELFETVMLLEDTPAVLSLGTLRRSRVFFPLCQVQGMLSHGPAETENFKKNDDNEEIQSDQLQGVPEWL